MSQGWVPVCPRDGSRFVPGTVPVRPRDGSCLSRTLSRPKRLCLLLFLARRKAFFFLQSKPREPRKPRNKVRIVQKILGKVSDYSLSLTDFFGSQMVNRFLSSAGVGKSCVLPMHVPNPSPTLDKDLASMGPGILSSAGVGVWKKGPEAFFRLQHLV